MAESLGGRAAVARQPANDHLQRSAASVVTNVGEGLGEMSTGDKVRLYRYAHRSAVECEHALRSLTAVGAVANEDLLCALRLLKDVKLDLRRLINAFTRSPPHLPGPAPLRSPRRG